MSSLQNAGILDVSKAPTSSNSVHFESSNFPRNSSNLRLAFLKPHFEDFTFLLESFYSSLCDTEILDVFQAPRPQKIAENVTEILQDAKCLCHSIDGRATALLADIRLFSPSKMSIISTPPSLEMVKDLGIVKETKKVFEIRLQKLHFGEFQEIQLFGVQNR